MTDTLVNLDDESDDLDDLDRDALERAMHMAQRRPLHAERLRQKLEDELWFAVAGFASNCCQCELLNLKPWQGPPCRASEDDLSPGDADAQKMLRKMLAAGISRYEPDPLAALERAKRKGTRSSALRPTSGIPVR